MSLDRPKNEILEPLDQQQSSKSSQKSIEDLHGSTLQTYWFILRFSKKNITYTDVQEFMGFSSKSSAIYQLNKLCELGILIKATKGYEIASKPKPRALKPFLFVKNFIIPKSFVYGLTLLIFHLFLIVFFLEIDEPAVILASIPNFIAVILFFLETFVIWQGRPITKLKEDSCPIFNRNKRINLCNLSTRTKVSVQQFSLKLSHLSIRRFYLSRRIRTAKWITFILLLVFFSFLSIISPLYYSKSQFIVDTNVKSEIKLSTPVFMQLKLSGYTFYESYFYGLRDDLMNENQLIEISLNSGIIENYSQYSLISSPPFIGRGLSYNGSLFWSLEEKVNSSMEQRVFCFSKELSYIDNFTINSSKNAIFTEDDLELRDLAIWNDTMLVLEWWGNISLWPKISSVSLYELNTFQRIGSYEIPLGATSIFFDESGQLWVYYDGQYLSEHKYSFISISITKGLIQKAVLAFDESQVEPLEHYYYHYNPLIYNETIIYPLAKEIEGLTHFWGFVVIKYNIKGFFPASLTIWGVLITVVILSYLFIRFYFKKKALMSLG